MVNKNNEMSCTWAIATSLTQGRSQEVETGGANLLGEGSGVRFGPPVGPGQSPGKGARGANPPGSSRVLNN